MGIILHEWLRDSVSTRPTPARAVMEGSMILLQVWVLKAGRVGGETGEKCKARRGRPHGSSGSRPSPSSMHESTFEFRSRWGPLS